MGRLGSHRLLRPILVRTILQDFCDLILSARTVCTVR